MLCLMIVGIYVGIATWQWGLFCVINVIGIMLPGYLLLCWSGLRFKSTTSTLLTAYGIGYAMAAAYYALLLVCGGQFLSGWLWWGLSAVCLMTLLIKHVRCNLSSILMGKDHDVILLLVLFIILAVFCPVMFQQPIRSVEATGYQDIPYDQMYWMRNCVAATKGFPLPEMSISGYQMYWHMFSCFNIALFHFATGIEIFNLCFSLSYVWHILLLLGGAYTLARELLTERKFVLMTLILILLCSSAEYYTDIYYLVHLWYCTMGTPEAIASELFGFLLLIKITEGQQMNWKGCALLALFTSCTMGYKSPVGFVLLLGVGCKLLVTSLRERKLTVPSLTVLIAITLLSLLVLKVFITSDQTLTSPYSNNQVSLTFRTVTHAGFFQGIADVLTDVYGIEVHIAALLLAIPCLMTAHPAIPLLALVVVGLLMARGRIRLTDSVMLYVMLPLLAMCMTGMTAFLALTHYGFAQSYFMYALIPFAIVFSMVAIEKYLNGRNHSWLHFLYLYVGVSLLVMPVCAFCYEQDEEFYHSPRQISVEGTSLTLNEWEGLAWVRDHLPESAVIVTNKVLAPARGNRSYITSSYAERQVYFEGYISANLPNDHIVMDRIKRVANYFSGDLKSREELQKEGVTHVIIFKSLADVDKTTVTWGGMPVTLEFTPLSETDTRKGEVLFENEEIKVTTL